MEKIISRLPEFLSRAMAGDPTAIGLLTFAGISAVIKAVKDNKQTWKSKQIEGGNKNDGTEK